MSTLVENELVRKAVFFIAAVIAAMILSRISSKAIRRIFETGNVPRGSIVINLVRIIIWAFALLAVLEPVFGIQPTAFIAALGVTSVALSLGLQNTIGNLIGGLELMIAHVVEVGDWVEVGSYQGEVTDITWRSTTIRTLVGDVVVIPNSVLDATTLRKMSPISSRTITMPLDIHPEADMAAVEEDIRSAVSEAVAEWRDPAYNVELIEMGYGSFGFRLNIRVTLNSMDDAFAARSAVTRACSGRSWLARW